jgi:hypothetical protein
MFCKHLLVYINSKVPFHENLPPLPSHRSGVPDYTKGFFSFAIGEHFPVAQWIQCVAVMCEVVVRVMLKWVYFLEA